MLSTQNATSNNSMSLPNGHLSPLANNVMTMDKTGSDSDSDLSDINEPAGNANPLSPRSNSGLDHRSESYKRDDSSAASSDDDQQAGSDDAEYDLETPPAVDADISRHERSSSPESRRPAKRKAGGLEDDEHILNNPELYGLRRSVCSDPCECL